MQPLLELKGINKRFGKNTILQNVNLTIRQHEMLGLIGFSGSGKTTLLRTLMGFYAISSGKIYYKQQEITKKSSILKKLVGFATQENSFYDRLTIKENLDYFGSLNRLSTKEIKYRMDILLKLMRLNEVKTRRAGILSGGMKKRLDLAIALLHDPEIIILDEPTTGLDPLMSDEIYELISYIQKTGTTIIIASHNYDMLQRYADRIAILGNKTIVECDSAKQLLKKYHANTLVEVFRKVGEQDYKTIV